MKNIATEVSGKAFEKQKIIFDSVVVGISFKLDCTEKGLSRR
jgi:hypothetical protein